MSSRIPVHCELIDICLGLRQRVIAEALQRYAILLQEALSVLPLSEDPAQFIQLRTLRKLDGKAAAVLLYHL